MEDGSVSHSQGSVVGHERSVVSGMDSVMGSGGIGRLRVGLSLVSDISDESILMISVIRNNLDTAVRELHSVLS